MPRTPQPTEHHRWLQRFAGNWVGEERLAPPPVGPGGTAIGRLNIRVELDGFFVVEDYLEERNGRTVFKGHGVFGWDGEQKSYTLYWVDCMGSVPSSPARGKREGDTILFEAGKHSRYMYKFSGENSMYFKVENSQDDSRTWVTFLEANYQRVQPLESCR